MLIPFSRPRLYKTAPGGFTDVMCRQTVATLASYRPLWQAVLDKELYLMAEMRTRLRMISPNACLQLRVDGIIAKMPKKEKKRLLAWGDETWSSGGKKYKVEENDKDEHRAMSQCRQGHGRT